MKKATFQDIEIRDPAARASDAVEELRDMQGEKMILIQRDSVLDCGGPPPLWHCRLSFKSASRRRAGAALWRAAKAEGLAQSKTRRQFERASAFSASLCLVLSPLHSLCSFAAE
jgi:hypothetical protein